MFVKNSKLFKYGNEILLSVNKIKNEKNNMQIVILEKFIFNFLKDFKKILILSKPTINKNTITPINEAP